MSEEDYEFDERKLFIGGLSKNITRHDLWTYFDQYGAVDRLEIKEHIDTGVSRGFAFVLFDHHDSVDRVLSEEAHFIKGKFVEPSRAIAKQGKIYVGGLSPGTTDEEVKTFFGQFGKIAEVQRPFDKVSKQPKNFCFIIFESETVAHKLLMNPKQILGGKEVEVKPVIENQNGGRKRKRGGRRYGGVYKKGGFRIAYNQPVVYEHVNFVDDDYDLF